MSDGSTLFVGEILGPGPGSLSRGDLVVWYTNKIKLRDKRGGVVCVYRGVSEKGLAMVLTVNTKKKKSVSFESLRRVLG